MKKNYQKIVLVAAMFFSAAGVCFGQNADTILTNKIMSIFEEEGIMLSEIRLKNLQNDTKDKNLSKEERKKAEKDIKDYNSFGKKLSEDLLQRFIPVDFKLKSVSQQLTFDGVDISGLMGRIVYEENVDLLKKQSDVFIRNYCSTPDNTDRFKLFCSIEKLFTIGLKGEISGNYLSYYTQKFSQNINKSKEEKHSFGLLVGKFSNKLYDRFSDVKTVTGKDFAVLYKLWDYYQTHSDTNARMIKNFSGFWFYNHKGLEESNSIFANTDINSAGNLIFLEWNQNGNISLKNNTNISIEKESHTVYMFEQPEFFPLPTKQDIKRYWQGLQKNTVINGDKTVPILSSLTVPVLFGPVFFENDETTYMSDEKAFDLIKLDNASHKFLKEIKLLKATRQDNGFYKCEIQISSNPETIADTTVNNSSEFRISPLQLRLWYKIAGNNIGDTLDIKYTVNDLLVEALPIFEFDYLGNNYDEEINKTFKKSVRHHNDSIVEGEILLTIKKPNNYQEENYKITNVEIANIEIDGHNIDKTNAKFTTNQGNKFKCKITIPDNPIYFTGQEQYCNVKITVKFRDRNTTYKRYFEFKLNEPHFFRNEIDH